MLVTPHVYPSPYHPQASSKLERLHETLKARLNLLVYTSPESLRAAMADPMDYTSSGSTTRVSGA
jgi:hypothetical protein